MQYIALEHEELPYEINEEIKLLRTNLQFCGADKRVIAITSAIASEGKSTTVLNLCCSFADQNKTVLLVDCDLRRSVLRKRVVEGRVHLGTSHYLSGQCELEDVVYETDVPGLHMICSLVVPPNPSELLSGDRLGELLAWGRENYDYVIVDCPPLGMVVDAAVIAPRCDGIAIVISSGDISYRMAQDVIRRLETTKCPILGVILNKVDRRGNGKYYGRYYGRYYGKKYSGYYY